MTFCVIEYKQTMDWSYIGFFIMSQFLLTSSAMFSRLECWLSIGYILENSQRHDVFNKCNLIVHNGYDLLTIIRLNPFNIYKLYISKAAVASTFVSVTQVL